MAEKKVEIEFLGDSSSLIGSINSTIAAMGRIESQSKSFAMSMANMAVKQLAPIAAAVAGAFAAKKALQDFADSKLPGAAAFKAGLEESKKSLTALSAAVGEFLAPTTALFARIAKSIADFLTPLVRQFTALVASAKEFGKVLASNIVQAFAPLVPTATAAVKWIKGLFSGPSRDWAKDIEWFRREWNRIWGEILTYAAPILIAAAGAIEAGLVAIKNVAIATFNIIKVYAKQAADVFRDLFPPDAGGGAMELAKAIQQGLVTAFVAVEFAIKNWQQTFEIAKTAVLLGFEKVRNFVTSFGTYAIDLFSVIGSNMANVFTHYTGELLPVFQTLGQNIIAIFKAAFEAVKTSFLNVIMQMVSVAGNPVEAFKAISAGGVVKDMFLGGLETLFPTSVNPDWSGVKELPGVAPLPNDQWQPLPGWDMPGPTDRERNLQKELGDLISGAVTDFAPFLKGRMGEIEKAIGPFIAQITKNLPGLSAKVDPMVDTASAKRSAAVNWGTRDAYSAIIAATAGKGDKQLAESKKQTRLLERLAGQKFPGAGI